MIYNIYAEIRIYLHNDARRFRNKSSFRLNYGEQSRVVSALLLAVKQTPAAPNISVDIFIVVICDIHSTQPQEVQMTSEEQ